MIYKSQNYRSYFSYSLTRPYPLRWFTPVAICLLVATVVIFSLINFASSGYVLVVQPTKNPNATLEENVWLQRWPSFMTNKVRPKCDPLAIPVKTQLFTNNTALTYTLTDVWQDGVDEERNISSSLLYHNNFLEDCRITAIDIDFDSQDRSAVQISYSEWGAKVSVFTTCSINNTPNGPTMLNLTMLYNYVPNNVRYGQQQVFLGTMFLSRNISTQASLYWGESLLSMSWATTCREIQDIRSRANRAVNKGTVNFRSRTNTTASITDLDFFNLDYQFIQLQWNSSPSFFLPPQDRPLDIGFLDAEQEFPNIWIKADVLAKAAYSTVLTDLGQVGAQHNILNDAAQLQHFTANFSTWNGTTANAKPGPIVQDYATQGSNTGPLLIRPSVFVVDYLCQLPQRKPWPNLILSVLVADLVFLQAVWTLYKLVVDYFLAKQSPESMCCAGCKDMPEAIPLSEDDSI